jgi:hypothetical protein
MVRDIRTRVKPKSRETLNQAEHHTPFSAGVVAANACCPLLNEKWFSRHGLDLAFGPEARYIDLVIDLSASRWR